MQVSTKKLSDTKVQLTISADAETLARLKDETLQQFAHTTKVQGFREGKAPLHLVEKQVSPESLQTEFLEHAINFLYTHAATQKKLRPVAQPQVKITKFVPFTALEVESEVEILGDITMPDYKKLKIARKAVKVTAKDIDEVLAQLTKREAKKTPVDRAAKNGDEIWIDYAGVDTKTKEPINGANDKDYPLLLGSDTFIPGFEANVIGMKPGEEKTFTINFPKDYNIKALQNKDVTFTVTAKKVEELVEPKIDDALAAKVGPFKTVNELKEDIKKQLIAEQEAQADREFADEMIMAIAKDTKVAIPESLIDEQLDRMENDEKQNLIYRGQTWKEHLEAEGVTEAEHRKKNRPDAEMRVKAGLVLTEIADLEKITVTPEEFEIRMQLLMGQYPKMQAELKKPEARHEIASRMMSEKTLDKLKSYAAKA
jgi:trigger factor